MTIKTFMVAALVVIAAAAHAQAAFDNLYNTDGAPFSPFGGVGPIADSFSTGPSISLLTDVWLNLDQVAPDTGTLTVGLYSDNGTTPGSLLSSITESDTVVTSSSSILDFVFSSPYYLAANTRYWIGLTTQTSNIAWNSAGDDSGIGLSGEFFYLTTGGYNGVYSDSDGPFNMGLSAAAVPEPCPYLALLGGVGLLGLRRSKKVN